MSERPAKLEQFISRGDTDPIPFRLELENGTAINITGYTFRLSVDTVENPTDPNRPTATQVFAVDAVIVDAPAGRFEFPITILESNQTPGDYFYDVERFDGSNIRTIVKGRFVIGQDITKPI